MARQIPENRFEELVQHATEVFIACGYIRTQMAEVAEAVGVSKGTLYLYVESKEALFALCVTQAARTFPLSVPNKLPVVAPDPGELASLLQAVLSREVQSKPLADALARPRAQDIRKELDAVFRDHYETLERYCVGIKLLDRCQDHPEVGDSLGLGREPPRVLLADYLDSRMRAGQVRTHPDPRLLARIALETCVTWAVHIKWDPNPQNHDLVVAKEATLQFIVDGLLHAGAVAE